MNGITSFYQLHPSYKPLDQKTAPVGLKKTIWKRIKDIKARVPGIKPIGIMFVFTCISNSMNIKNSLQKMGYFVLIIIGKGVVLQITLIIYDLGLAALGPRPSKGNSQISMVRRLCWKEIIRQEEIMHSILDKADRFSSFILHLRTFKRLREENVSLPQRSFLETFRKIIVDNSVGLTFEILLTRASVTIVNLAISVPFLRMTQVGLAANFLVRTIMGLWGIHEAKKLHNAYMSINQGDYQITKYYLESCLKFSRFFVPMESFFDATIELSEEVIRAYAQLPKINDKIDYASYECVKFYQIFSNKDDEKFRKWLKSVSLGEESSYPSEEKWRKDIFTFSIDEDLAFKNLPRVNGKIEMGSKEFRAYFLKHSKIVQDFISLKNESEHSD